MGAAEMMNFVRLFKVSSEIVSLPEVTIRMCGDAGSEKIFRTFTGPHRRYKLIQNKRWGVALLELPNLFQEYLQGKGKQAVRSNRRRATDLGFRFGSLDASKHLDEILAINTSMESRQGNPMGVSYRSVERLRKWIDSEGMVWGIFDRENILKAYAHSSICGEVFIISRLLGHGQDLPNGIMYLLVSEIIREMSELKERERAPLWCMYDTFFGASPGLRYFKERLGFRPYKVRWVWQGQD